MNMMLEQHPDIYMCPVKETYYYVAEALRGLDDPSPEDLNDLATLETVRNYKTTQEYQSLFQDAGDARIIGESSHYIYYPNTVPAISKDCPDARILVCLRNPVYRLFSEYLFWLRVGVEKGHFADYVARYADGYLNGKISEKFNVPKLNKSLQAALLEPWIVQFGHDQVKLVLFDDLNRAPAETMNDIFKWLEIDESFTVQKIHAEKGGASKSQWLTNSLNPKSKILKHARSLIPKSTRVKMRSLVLSKNLKRPEMDAKTRAFLTEFYQDDVDQLSNIVGKDLSAWCQS